MNGFMDDIYSFSQTESYGSMSQFDQESLNNLAAQLEASTSRNDSLPMNEPEQETVPVTKKNTRKGSKNILFSMIGTFDTKEEAIAHLNTTGSYIRDYGSEKYGTKFKCKDHHECKHTGKITVNGGKFILEVGGTHSLLTKQRTHGMDNRVKQELDTLLEAGMTAGKALNKLQIKYNSDPVMFKKLPSNQQIQNRKQTIEKKKKLGRSIDSSAKFLAVAQDLFVDSKQKLEEKGEHDMIILKIAMDDTGDTTSYPIVFSSKSLLRNMVNVYRGQKEAGINVTMDGTYKLHQDGFTLIDFGSYGVHRDGDTYTQRFYPFLYVFSRSENTCVYELGLNSILNAAELFFGLGDFKEHVKIGLSDQALCITKAMKNVFPEINTYPCYPHIVRNLKDGWIHLKNKADHWDEMMDDIRSMHHSKNSKSFDVLWGRVKIAWNEKGEGDYATWFELLKLKKESKNWFFAATGIIGLSPNQNGIESHHRTQKSIAVERLRASTNELMMDTFPRIVMMGGTTRTTGNDPITYYQPGPIRGGSVAKAYKIIQSKSNYLRMEKESRFAFLSSQAEKYKLTASKVKKDWGGTVPTGMIHTVEILKDFDPGFMADLSSPEKMEEFRGSIKCNCKGHVSSSAPCCHIYAFWGLDGQLDLKSLGK